MRKNVFGRQFKRDANERKALFKNLLTSLVLHERIQTTHAKAKAIRGAADKLVTKAKKGGPEAYRQLHPLVNQNAVKKLIDVIGPRFAERPGGYTRIIRLGNRIVDNAPLVYLEWTERTAQVEIVSEKAAGVSKGADVQLMAEVKDEKKKSTKVKEEKKKVSKKETKKKDK